MARGRQQKWICLDCGAAEIRKLEREYRTAVNELCYMCGKYKQEHEGACRGCRWKKPV